MAKTASIFTFQWSDNYGTVLQAYALQTALEKLGVDAALVPLIPETMNGIKRYIGKSPRAIFLKWYWLLAKSERDRRKKFDGFRRLHFKYRVRGELPFAKCSRMVFADDYLIFGSDNIWAPDVVQIGQAQGDVFYGKAIVHPYKIAYAPSTGGDLRQNPLKAQVVAAIRQAGFKAISCREDATVDVLRAGGLAAERVPDPTLLLSADEWTAIEDASAIPKTPYYFGYDLGHANEMSVSDACQSLAADFGATSVVCYPNDWKKTMLAGCAPSPQQWLAQIHHAKGIVTNSFHGVMFSLIFGKPFVFIPIVGQYTGLNVRAFSILDRFDRMDCVYHPGDSLREKMSVACENPSLSGFGDVGYSFLKRALEL